MKIRHLINQNKIHLKAFKNCKIYLKAFKNFKKLSTKFYNSNTIRNSKKHL